MKDCFTAEVLSVAAITPSMMRVELGRGEMHRFTSSGWPDEWVRLIFPAEDGIVTMPHLIEGRWQMPEDRPKSGMRPYTIRRWNKHDATILVDFVLHEGGLASDWAIRTRPGDKIGVTSPFGKYAPPEETEQVLLIADATGLPAAGRILEEMPIHISAEVHIEIPDGSDVQLGIAMTRHVNWHFGFGLKPHVSRLSEIAKTLTLGKIPGYVWVAGEAKEVSAIRQHFVVDRGFAKDQVLAIGYWTQGKTRD